jgi:hypothetical protein
LYDDFDSQRGVVLPFVREGLKAGEQVFYVASEPPADDWLFEFQLGGIDVDRARTNGSLIVCEGEHWLSPGAFSSLGNARAAWDMIEEGLQSFEGVRFVVDAGWTLDPPIPYDLVCHWEATINVVNSDDVNVRTLCLYNTNRQSFLAVHSALRTHPIVVVGGKYRLNRYYEAERILENEPHLNHSLADAGMVEGILLELSRQQEYAGEPA